MPEPTAQPTAEDLQFLAAERDVEVHSETLRKELTLPNLVFTQVLSILGLSWIGTAGKLGSSHFSFWIAAICLFHIPQAWVVIHLNNEMPLEGGLYQWTKLRFNEMTGFLVAWNVLLYAVIFSSEMGLLMMNNVAYALGPSGAWLANSKPAICAASVAITAGLVVMARVGLSLGKWIHGFSGFLILFLFAAMAAFALPRWFTGAVAHTPVSLAIPAFTLLNLNILGKMGFGAFGGFDTCSIFAGECRGSGDSGVARTIRRSVWIATPIIAGAFILGTACVLTFVKPADIDLISPITQVLNRGLNAAGFSGSATSVIGALIVLTLVGQALLSFNSAARLPLVAGWDNLLPSWSTRLHPRYRTPVGSITVLGAVVLTLALLSALGSGNQEAYQVLQSSNGICYGLAYLGLFAIPLFAPGERTPVALKVAAASGFLMTLLNVTLSVFPIIDVPDAALFAAKVGGTVIILNACGVFIYVRAARIRRARNG
jgi:amino acid transporter